MKQFANVIYDVIVVGGGPAGMMAAGRAAERGLSVILLEKNGSLGKKLLITGGGRCNITNATFDNRVMLSKYKGREKYLFSAFAQFGVKDTLSFFESRGLAMKIEAESRVFPKSDTAESVWQILLDYMREHKVDIHTKSEVESFDLSNNLITVKLKSKVNVWSKQVVIATGGLSRPETGSTGDGLGWLKHFGVQVNDNEMALVPVAIKDKWVKDLAGVTVKDIKISTFQNNKKQQSNIGKLLFTHVGITGPTILNMSRDIGELLKYGDVQIRLDFLPGLDHGELKKSFRDFLQENSNKKIKNSLKQFVPNALVSVILSQAGIDPDTFNHSVGHTQRKKVLELMKGLPLEVKGLLGQNKAIVSSGGVKLDEVDGKTMKLRKYPQITVVGDVLDIDRPSGGYSLQLCWTTGYVAGNHI